MKKLNLAIMLALGLIIPVSALATDSTDEVTIRMMNMNEYSSGNLTRNIELPDMASEQAETSALARKAYRLRELNEDGSGLGPADGDGQGAGDGSGYGPGAGFGGAHEGAGADNIEVSGYAHEAGDLDRDRIQDQDRELIRDMDQDRDMDRDGALELEQDRSMFQQQHEMDDDVKDQQGPGNEAPGNNQQGPGPAE